MSYLKKIIVAGILVTSSAYHMLIAQDWMTEAPKATVDEVKLPFRELPDLKQAFIDTAPKIRQDGIPVAELKAKDGNKNMLVALAQEIAKGQHSNFDSLLIAHKGKLVFESYYKRGRIDLPHPQASATKAYTSLIVGRAIQMGYLSVDDLHKPIADFFTELNPKKFAAGVEKVTLHKLMTMHSGLRISDEKTEELESQPALIEGEKFVQKVLELTTPITEDSQKFKYQNDPILVMHVIDAVVPGTVEAFIKTELLDKLGISNYVWNTSPSGIPEAGWRTNMTSRDMMKFGLLAMNKGIWQGEQLIPAAYVTKAIGPIADMQHEDIFYVTNKVVNPGYGYYWWLADLKVGDKTYTVTSAFGGSGQMIILVEDLDIMIITTVHQLDANVFHIAAERILPAFVQ